MTQPIRVQIRIYDDDRELFTLLNNMPARYRATALVLWARQGLATQPAENADQLLQTIASPVQDSIANLQQPLVTLAEPMEKPVQNAGEDAPQTDANDTTGPEDSDNFMTTVAQNLLGSFT